MVTERLGAAHDRGIDITVGTVDEALRATVESALPEIEVFASGREWLRSSTADDDTEIGRLMLVDRESRHSATSPSTS